LGYAIPDEKVFGTTKWAEKKGLLAPESQTPAGLAGQTVGNLLFPLGAGKSTQIADGLLTAQANAAAPRVLRKESGMFIGPGAKTWDAQAAKKAQTMAAKGIDPKTIWNETGTFKGPDGMWRQEIDDSAARMQMDWLDSARISRRGGGAPYVVDEVIDHPKLMDAYNDIGDVAVFPNKSKDLGASYNTTDDSITIKFGDQNKFTPARVPTTGQRSSLEEIGDSGSPPSNLLHELQHAIQQREGFAQGGTPTGLMEALRNDAVDMRRAASKLDSSAWRNDPLGPAELLKPGARKRALEMERQAQKLENWAGRIDTFGDGYAHDAYRHLAGEAEARATQARMNMNMAQRREVFPLDSYDVPIDQLIVRRGLLDGPAMAIDPKAQKKLVQGLLSPGTNERYRLGDVTQKQSADAYVFGGNPVGESRNVYASPDILEDHARVSRMAEDNFLANEVGLFSKQAMRPDSDVIQPTKKGDYPLLRSKPALDPVTRKIYNAEMALKPVGDGFEAITVIPRGLPPRKKPR
jgi:hypothetical protein